MMHTPDLEHAEPFRLRDIGWMLVGLTALIALSIWERIKHASAAIAQTISGTFYD